MAKRLKATVFTTEDIRQRGIKDCVTDALNKAGNGCDKIYVGIDMDVLDGGYVSMTGTPRFDGLKNIDLFEAMGLMASSPVNAISLCGLNPTIEIMSLGKTGQRCGVEMLVRFLDPKLRGLHRKASIT
jgi:arginase family enzyme